MPPLSFAFSEVLAHVNHMLREDALIWAGSQHGIECVVAEDGCTDYSRLEHEVGLRALEAFCRIAPARTIAAELGLGATGVRDP